MCINPQMVPMTTYKMRPHTTTQDRNTLSANQVGDHAVSWLLEHIHWFQLSHKLKRERGKRRNRIIIRKLTTTKLKRLAGP